MNQNGTSGNYYNVIGDGTDLNMTAPLGVSAGLSYQLWVRFDFTNAVLHASLTAGSLTGAAGVTLAGGGAAGNDHVIFGVRGTATAPTNTTMMTLALPSLAIGMGATGVTMTVYDGGTDANARSRTNPLSTTSLSTAVTAAPALLVDITPGQLTADVTTGFTSFVSSTSGTTPPSTSMGSVGTISLTKMITYRQQSDGTALGANAAATDLSNIAQAVGNVTFTGDFSLRGSTWSVAADDSCTGGQNLGGRGMVRTSGTVSVARLTDSANDGGAPLVVLRQAAGVAAVPWNQWQLSRGMGGRLRPESMAGLVWNAHPNRRLLVQMPVKGRQRARLRSSRTGEMLAITAGYAKGPSLC